MKTNGIQFLFGAVLILTVSFACQKSDQFNINQLEGMYNGTINSTLVNKNGLIDSSGIAHDATMNVFHATESELEFHCVSDLIDTVLTMAYYPHNDSLMLCESADNFKEMYGHMMGEGHQAGSMMSDRTSSQTDWEHHTADEHEGADSHSGGFNMLNTSLEIVFEMDGKMWQFKGNKRR